MSALVRWMTAPAIQIAGLVGDTAAVMRREARYRDVPAVDPNAGVIAETLVDGGFSLAVNLLVGVPEAQQLRRGHQELLTTRDFLDRQGWLENPAGYHQTPPSLRLPQITSRTARVFGRRVAYREVSYDSEYEPHPGEPGRERWLAYEENGTGLAQLLEHEDGDRPWIVATHGFAMGSPSLNLSGLSARWLHEELGLNVLMPVLPLHGLRSSTRFSGRALLQPEYSNVSHLFAQAVWDLRRLVGWVRSRSDAPIGLYGISLGAYVTALAAAFIDDLACVVTGIPAVDFASLARDNEPTAYKAYGEDVQTDWGLVRQIIHPVSPLAYEPRVPREGRFIFAGVADRVARPDQARSLWRHWDKPRIEWLPTGHVLATMKRDARPFLREVAAARLYPKGEAPFAVRAERIERDAAEAP